MDEERAQVFDDEDGAPGDLGAEVFDLDGVAILQLGAGDGDALVVGDGGAGGKGDS